MRKFIWYLKGATCYELQIGPHEFRWCHLSGGYYNWKFWRRFGYAYWINWKG